MGMKEIKSRATCTFAAALCFLCFAQSMHLAYQFNRRGINSPDGPLEAPRQPEITSPSLSEKLRMCLLVMLDSFPEKLLNQRDIPCAIGV